MLVEKRPAHKLFANFVIAGAVAMLVAGCSSGATDTGAKSTNTCERNTGKTIAVDHPYSNIPLYANLKRFANKEASQRGYKIVWPADNAELDTQNRNLQALVAQKIPALMVYPLEPSSIKPLLKQAKSNCTVVVTYASVTGEEDANIGLSNTETGKKLGVNAVSWAEKKNINAKALILNDDDVSAAKERINGLLDGLKTGTGKKIEVVANQKATSPQQAQTVAQQVLQAHPEINMILGMNDDWALAGLQAIRNLNRSDTDPNLYVGGMDGAENALKELKKNNAFRCSIGYDITQIARLMVDVPADILEGKKLEPVVAVPLVVLTPGNPAVDKFLKDLS